ncbi:MAG: D-aminoacyl-tRNA deacylase [Sumerlaeia bacterium]
MRFLIQRVSHASVQVEGQLVSQIQQGLLVLVGLGEGDCEAVFPKMIDKLINLRIFDDEKGIPNNSVQNVGGGILLVSQFTLYADTKKGRRPSYTGALAPNLAAPLFDKLVECISLQVPDLKVETGRFGAMMNVSSCNAGPYTLWLDSSQFAE